MLETAAEKAATAGNPSVEQSKPSPGESAGKAEDKEDGVAEIPQAHGTTPKAEPPRCLDPRLLGDKTRYRKLHGDVYMVFRGSWIPSYSPEEYKALVALHRKLMDEHHDFLLASQHPSASAALKRLAEKYNMPARMWRHGIHSFLELLRPRLPESHEHLVLYLYMTYSMLCLLDETVPAFSSILKECRADVARYRYVTASSFISPRGPAIA